MSSDKPSDTKRRPAAFSLDNPEVIEKNEPVFDYEEAEPSETPVLANAPVSRFSWFSIFWGAIGGLLVLSVIAWLMSYVSSLFFRDDWIGYLSLGLLGLAILSAIAILVSELVALGRLRKLGEYRRLAELAIEEKELTKASKVVNSLEKLLADRPESQWGLSRLRDNRQDILDADELLILAERELVEGLDKLAREQVVSSARRVAAITTVSPAPLLDIFIVAYFNLGLLRNIALLYGGRPGIYGSFRLARLVITHLTLTGGVALTSDVLQQLMGQKLAAKISSKLGEGLFNGTMTARIGIAAIEVCRPLPFIKSRKPGLREIAGHMFSGFAKT